MHTRRLVGLAPSSLPSARAGLLASCCRTVSASGSRLSTPGGVAQLRGSSRSGGVGRGALIAGRGWRGCAQPGLAMTRIHCRLAHNKAGTIHDEDRRMIVMQGLVPLEPISPQELRNEVDRLERTADAVIPPRRYCSLLVACTNGKLRARILRLADKVMDLSAAESAAHSYGLIFQVLWKSRVVHRRELDSLIATVLSTMRDQDVSVNGQGLNHLLRLYISYGDVAKACELFDLLREGEGRWRTQPNVITYTTLIRGLAGRADANVRPDLPRALAYFDQMERDSLRPDCMAYTALIHVCAEADDLPRALQVWGNMKRAGVAPDTFTFNSLIHACSRALDLDLAHKFMDDMQKPKWGQLAPDDITYSSLIDLCCRVNDFVRAHELLNEMKARGIAPTVFTFSGLISGYAAAGDVELCYEVLERMKQERVRPNHVTLVSLVNACLNAGDFRKAVETLGNMKRQYNLAPDRHTLHLLISKAGPQAKANDLVRLFERIEATEGVPLASSIYAELIKLCGARNELELAFLIYDKAQRQHLPGGATTDVEGQRQLDRSLIVACLQNNNPSKALDIVDAVVERESLKEHSVVNVEGEEMVLNEEDAQDVLDVKLFNSLLRAVEPSAVESVIDRMKLLQVAPDMRTIDLLLVHYESTQRLDRMWALLRELQEQKVIEREDLIYNSFIKVFLHRDDTDKAFTVLTELLSRNTALQPSTYHLFLGLNDDQADTQDKTARRENVNKRAALVPQLVSLLYERHPSAPPTVLLPFIHFCELNRKVDMLRPLIERLEKEAGSGVALVTSIQETVDEEALANGKNTHKYDRNEHAMGLLMPVVRAYILLYNADSAIELIRAARQRGLKITAEAYHALARLATPESPGSALRLRALMRADRVPDEDTQDPFAPLDHQTLAARPQRQPRQQRQRLAPVTDDEAPREPQYVINEEHGLELELKSDPQQPTTAAAARNAAAERKQRRKDKRREERENEAEVKAATEKRAAEPSTDKQKTKTKPAPAGYSLLSLSLSLLGRKTHAKRE